MNSTAYGILQARKLEWVAFPFSRGSSNLEIEPRSPTLEVDSLPVEPQGKPTVYTSIPQNELLVYLTKCVQDLHKKNYKTLMNISKKDKWRDIPCSLIRTFNIIKTLVLSNLIRRFNAILIKIPASYFTDIEKLVLKFYGETNDLEYSTH